MTTPAGPLGPIGPGPVSPLGGEGASRPGPVAPGTPTFGDILEDQIKKVNQLQEEADTAFGKLASGETQNVEEVVLAAKKAELAFQLMMQIRNKLVNAFEEIMRMRT